MAFVRHSNGKFAKKSSNIRLKKLEASRIRRFSKSHIITEHDYNILPGTLNYIVLQFIQDQDSRLGHASVTLTGLSTTTLSTADRLDQNDTHTDEGSVTNWNVGRRIIDIGVLANGLKACHQCQLCAQPLHLSNCVGETRHGLGGFLHVQCGYSACGLVNKIPTGSRHGKIWNVNTKLASGKHTIIITMCYILTQ